MNRVGTDLPGFLFGVNVWRLPEFFWLGGDPSARKNMFDLIWKT